MKRRLYSRNTWPHLPKEPCLATSLKTHLINKAEVLLFKPGTDDNLSIFTRECHHKYRGIHRGSLGQNHLRNSVIYVGYKYHYVSSAVLFVLDVLRLYNVSIKWVFANTRNTTLAKLQKGYFDMVGELWPMHDEFGTLVDISAVIEEEYETFYNQRGEFALTSVVGILLEYQLAICLLLVALVCAILVFAVVEQKEMNAWNSGSTIDSSLFLLCNFVNCPSETALANNSRYRA